jgi:hypothetical protein
MFQVVRKLYSTNKEKAMFYDIKRATYEALMNVVNTSKPYVGTTNAYPLGAREYSDRHFRLQGDGTIVCYYSNRKQVDGVIEGTLQDRTWHKQFATIYPDNTIEFDRPTTHMGENMILRRMLGGNVYHEKARGGTMFTYRTANDQMIMHPVFNGLVIDLSTQQSTKPYVINTKRLNQKKAKEYLAQYSNMKEVAKVMIDPMSDEGIRETLIDLNKEFKEKMWMKPTLVVDLLDQRRIVDAAIMLASLENINYINWDHSNMVLGRSFKVNLFEKIHTKLNDIILQGTDIPFILEPHEGGKYFPTSKWGYTIVQDNEVKTRY